VQDEPVGITTAAPSLSDDVARPPRPVQPARGRWAGERPELQRPRMCRARRLGRALEQPPAAHAGPTQGLAGLRGPPRALGAVPRPPGLPPGHRAGGRPVLPST